MSYNMKESLTTLTLTLASDNFDHFNSSSNYSRTGSEQLHPAPTFSHASLVKSIALGIMFVISLIGNTITFCQMWRIRRRRCSIHTLILHLSAADLVVTFFCDLTQAVWESTVQWHGGDPLCRVLKFLQVFGLYLSTYIVVVISIDRCLAILDPMSRNKAPRRVVIMISVAWALSFVFSLPQMYIFRVKRGPFSTEFYQCVTFGAYTEPWQEQLYSILSILLMFLIPLLIMVTAYTFVLSTIAKKSHDLQQELQNMETSSLSRGPFRGKLFYKAKVKSLRMTALIVVGFIVCWTPYYVLYIITTFVDQRSKYSEGAKTWIFFFGMANSMVNPLIYGAFQIRQKKRCSDNLPHIRFRAHPTPEASTACKQLSSSQERHQMACNGVYAGSQSIDIGMTTAQKSAKLTHILILNRVST